MDKVDVHVHVFARLSDGYPREVSRLAPSDKEGTAEQLLREMDAAGIDRAVLIEMNGTRIEYHKYVAHCVEKWPNRFTATGLVDVNDPDPSARLRELVEATGIEGIRIGDLGDPGAAYVEDLKSYTLFQCADELGININIYTGSVNISCVEMLAEAFPKVNISLDHLSVMPSTSGSTDRWGRPRFDNEPLPPPTYPRVLDMVRFPNVYIKVSGEYAFSKVPWPYEDMRPMVEQIYQAYGPGRMMWCSDSPWILDEPGYQRLVALIDEHLPAISEDEKDQIMGGTALKIWFKNK